MGKIIISVISDLVTDQRIYKVATTLHNAGYTVLVVGAKRRHSKALELYSYATHRINLLFNKGFGMYAEWNIRLFFYLLFAKGKKILLANDLDTLLPNVLVAKLLRLPVVYDSHELFCEQEEVAARPRVQKTWQLIEKFCVPKLTAMYTVNSSIAAIYSKQYSLPVSVVHNFPFLVKPSADAFFDMGFANGRTILLSQGTGINHNRGYEELVAAMKLLPETYVLVLVGGGLVYAKLQQLVVQLGLLHKVHFTGVVSIAQLQYITKQACIGFTIDKPTCANHYHISPNKLTDYIHAQVPVIGSNTPFVASILNVYKVGIVLPVVTPQAIANAVLTIVANPTQIALYKQNAETAKHKLCWENETKTLLSIFEKISK